MQGRRHWTLLVILMLVGTAAGAGELILPGEVFFYRPVASVTGQSAIWINPAALGHRQRGTMFMATHRQKRLVRDWGLAGTSRLLGAANRSIDFGEAGSYKEYVLAFGTGRRTGFGLSYRYITDGPGYWHKRHLWNIGLLVQRSRNFSLGARAENLNRGRIDGVRSDIRFVYGAAYRAYRDMVTLSFDVDMTHKENLNEADFRTGVEVRPMPGMYLYADVDNHSHINIGLRLNLGSNFVGHYHNFDRDVKSMQSTSYVGSVMGRQPSLLKSQKKTLMVTLDGTLPENPELPFFGRRPLRYFDYVEGIYQAADDDEIDALYLRIDLLRCGLGKVEELGEALSYFRSRGKPVHAYVMTPNALGYLLACHADSIIIPPVSEVRLMGLYAEVKMYKGLMDKLGVTLEIERVDEYKTAPEQYIFDRPSEPSREQLNRLLDTLFSGMVTIVSTHRGLPADSVRALIDVAPLTAPQAVAAGLVDRRLYADEALDAFAGRNGLLGGRRMSLYAYVDRPEYDDVWGGPDRVAILIADGEIARGGSGGKIGRHEMPAAIRRVRHDRDIKAVVLRINSPGGDALAADAIWHEIEKTVRVKPMVISIGNVAASGGYYIAAVDCPVYLNRLSQTGSIGVYAGKINFAGLYDKLDVYTEVISRGENAAMYATSEPFTPDQRRRLREELWGFYRHFTEKVAAVRPLTADSVNALGRGQVWTGVEAVANGLADSLGGIHQAIAAACRLAGLETDNIVLEAYPSRYFFFKNPFQLPDPLALLGGVSGDEGDAITSLADPETGNIFFRLPYDITIR